MLLPLTTMLTLLPYIIHNGSTPTYTRMLYFNYKKFQIREDYTLRVRAERAKLIPFMLAERQKQENENVKVRLKFDKLQIGKKLFSLNENSDKIVPAN